MAIYTMSCEQHAEQRIPSDDTTLVVFQPPTDPENVVTHPEYGEGTAYITAQCPKSDGEILQRLVDSQVMFEVLQVTEVDIQFIHLDKIIDLPKPAIEAEQHQAN